MRLNVYFPKSLHFPKIHIFLISVFIKNYGRFFIILIADLDLDVTCYYMEKYVNDFVTFLR